MDFQILKKDNKRKYIIGSIVIIAIIVTITYIGTRAKYRMTSSMQLASGTINYEFSDLELVAVKLQNDFGEYESINEIPSSGYTLNKEKSICKVGENKVIVPIEYRGKVYIGVHEKGTKCTLYFDKGEFKTKDLILSQNIIDNSRVSGSFSSIFEEDTSGRIFNSIDDDGETFFFAGSNPNNWVKFGTNKEGQELYWRIIRINGDETIRMIYNGITTDQTGETTQIGLSAYNENTGDNAYVGYMYGTPGSNTYDETHANTNSSTIKEYLDTWYEENLKINYEQYIDENAGFCGDRVLSRITGENYGAKGDGYYQAQSGYGAFGRIFENNSYKSIQNSTFQCIQKADFYTLKASADGNKALIDPIGLITVDEAIFSGGKGGYISNFWLKSGQEYWTISPGYYFNGSSFLLRISSGGEIFSRYVGKSNGVRPVINLKSDTLKVGSGTTSNPYRVL